MNIHNQPIAIVGIGCRLPGGAVDTSSLWQLLLNKFDAVTEIPPDRWSLSAFYDSKHGRPAKTYAKWGAFLPNIDKFDPAFFGIADAEAEVMDPQQRLLLETAWEAMEDAGHVPNPKGDRMGVFVGISTRDYEILQSNVGELNPNEPSPYIATGLASSIAANRLSYCFNFNGPSLAVDTACSSSLIAVHLACQSIARGECDAALAAGVNCLVSPNNFIAFSGMGVLSAKGRCRTFDAAGDGFVRGEGAGAILLRPLNLALARGDAIYAVIIASGTNQDGRTQGLALPSLESQSALLAKTCAQAGVVPKKLVYVEAHGTGTPVGDPIEAAALGEILGEGRGPGQELLVGSIKSNIGHLEAGAGIAGIIKCALCLKNGAAPPNLHFDSPNPAIKFDQWHLKVPTEVEHFPTLREDDPNSTWLAGVNSFGFGGSNAFVLLRSAPKRFQELRRDLSASTSHNQTYILPISARNFKALSTLAQRYADYLKQDFTAENNTLDDVIFSAAMRRRHHEHRLAVVGQSRQELHDQLLAFAKGDQLPWTAYGEARNQSGPVFVFSGQGAQWHAMGRQLYEKEPVFRQTIERCHAALEDFKDWSLMDEFLAGPEHSRIEQTSVAQPLITAVQLGLAAMWEHWGISPKATVGHSVGEVAASCVAGVFNLETAMRVIYHRGASMSYASGKGGMLAVGLSIEDYHATILPAKESVDIAAINSPTSITLSGDLSELKTIASHLDGQGLWNTFVPVNCAFHSAHMDEVRQPLMAALESLRPQRAKVPIYSTVTGKLATGLEFDASYWWDNVRQPVRFYSAISAIVDAGFSTFIELSAHPVLSTSLKQCLPVSSRDAGYTVLNSLHRQKDDQKVMLCSLGELHCLGFDIQWENITKATSRFVRLPGTPWEHRHYWSETPEQERARHAQVKHPLLMHRINTIDPTWICHADMRLLPYLRDHLVQGRPVFPATGYIELALAVAAEIYPDKVCYIQDFEIESALFLMQGNRAAKIQIRFDTNNNQFFISSKTAHGEEGWSRNAKGSIREMRILCTPCFENIGEIRNRCQPELDPKLLYLQAQQWGLNYGPLFRNVSCFWRRSGEALCKVEVPGELLDDISRYHLHPALFDAAFQLAFICTDESDPQGPLGMFLPYAFDRLAYFAPLEQKFWAYARVIKQGRSTLVMELKIIADDGRVLGVLENLRHRQVDNFDADLFFNWLYEQQWQLKPLLTSTKLKNRCAPVRFMPAREEFRRFMETHAIGIRNRLCHADMLRQAEKNLLLLWQAYLYQAFHKLGWEIKPGDTFTMKDAISQLGLPAEKEELLDFSLTVLSKDGLLRQDPASQTWYVIANPVTPESVLNLWRMLLDQFPGLFYEIMLVKHCGELFDAILTGDVDLGSSAHIKHIKELYLDSRICAPIWLTANLLIRRALAELVTRLPVGFHLKILEVNAGKGQLWRHLLAELSSSSSFYVASDESAEALIHVEGRLREFPNAECRMYNLGDCHEGRDLPIGEFDLVVGADLLSFVSAPQSYLTSLWECLVPGGLLLFSEPDSNSIIQNILYRIMHETEKSGDHHPCYSHTLPRRDEWLNLLRDAGFINAIAFSDTNGCTENGRCVYLATKPLNAIEVQGNPHADHPDKVSSAFQIDKYGHGWLILGDQSGLGQKLADELITRGQSCRIAYPSEVRNGWSVLLDKQYKGIVYLWSMDIPNEDMPSNSDIQQLQDVGAYSVLGLVQSLIKRKEERNSPHLWLVTRNAVMVDIDSGPTALAQVPIIALGRVLANEHPEFRCHSIDLFSGDENELVKCLLGELLGDDGEDLVVLREEARYVPRISRISKIDGISDSSPVSGTDGPCRLQIGKTGSTDNLRLRPMARRDPAHDEVEIAVCAVGLNFRDVMKTLGIYPGEAPDANFLGDEYAGVVLQKGQSVTQFAIGDRVFGLGLGAMATHLTVPAAMLLHLPSHLTMEDAATIPVAYFTAYHALQRLAKMRSGERILIHSAAGGVGLAASYLALHAGLEVYGTAGSTLKRQFLRDLGLHHVSDSRSVRFAEEILAYSMNEGVDIILNSLAGEAIVRSLELLRVHGRFLELGKRDIYGGSAISLHPFRQSLSYFAIDMARAMSPEQSGPLLQEIRLLLEQEVVKPLPYRIFQFADASEAFREMAQGRHVGKIVLTVDQTSLVSREAVSNARFPMCGDATYLITGGLRGLGLSLAEYMANRGVKYLALTSSSGPVSEEAQEGLNRLRAKGVTVLARKSDVANLNEMEEFFKEIDSALPPLRGLIHASAVYRDCFIRDMDQESFDLVMQPKAYGAWNLHLLTRNRKLDFFVLLSSISAVIGNLGQANYVAANMFCEAVANERRRLRLPALALQLDRIKDVGFVTRSPELAQHFSRLQWRGIHSAQAFEALQRFLANGACQGLISSFKWTRQSSGLGALIRSSRFDLVAHDEINTGEDASAVGLRERLSTAGAQEQLDIVAEFLRREIADVLRVSPHLVSFDRPLKQIGIDSLMAVELMARIEAKIGIALPIHRFAGESTPLDLVHGALSMLSGDSSPVAEPSHHTLQRLDSDASRSIDDGITQGTVSNGINPLDAKATIQAGGVLEPSSTSPRDAPPAAEPDQRTESYQMIGRPAQSNDERSLITRSAGEHEHMHYQMRAQMIQQRAASKGTQMAEEAFVPKMPDVKPIRPKADKHRMNVPERFTRLDLHPGYLQLVEAEEVATTLGIPSPFFREHQGPARDTIRIGSKDYINYATYNYLGFSGDPDIIAAASEAMREHGTSASASRVVSGQLTIHSELERAIASTLQVEDCVVLVSGHATNVTTIGYLFGPRDLIVHDELIHNSIIQGIQLAGSKRLPFPHNDWGALRAMLDEQRLIYERVLIVLEGIYSMDGDFPDLPRFIELKRRYQCFLMVDEAHSFGVMGRNGLGIREHFNLSGGDIDIWMGTLSKTLAACGGFIAGSSVLVENLRHLAPGILYSVGLAPSLAGAALASLAKLLREPRRVDVLHARGRLFLDLAKGAGIDTGTSAGLSVIPAITGSSLRAMLVSNALFEQGINVLPVIYPAVPEKQARLRFFVSCLHTEEQIRGTVTALAKALDRH